LTYAPLWCKSNGSFLEGASHPEELVDTAADLGLGALALTDRNGVYGAVRAFDRARFRRLPLILGAQVTVEATTTLVLLVRDREGWARLCRLLTEGRQGRAKGEFGLTWAQVAAQAQGLTALWRPEALGAPHPELAVLSEAFPGRLHALAARHLWVQDPLVERETLAWAGQWDLPVVAAPEVLYHRPERQELQDVLTCIRHGVRLADAGTRLRPNAAHALRDPEAFRALYADHPEWIDRTLEVAADCFFSLAEIEYRYPEDGVPGGQSTSGWLRRLTTDGARLRYPQGVPPAVEAQLEKELSLVEELRYSGYFLTMWEIVQFCKREGILCQGRGSAANSAVCYCLGITAVDPVHMDLLFERFLSRERAEPPDIDLDIEHQRREEVIQYMYQRYGRHRAAMVANVVRYRSRSALREVGKVLDLPEVDLDRASKLLSHHDEGIEGALRDAGMDPGAGATQTLVRLAGELQGFPRHLSIHPGGFLLGGEALDRIVPVEPAAMEGRTVLQWDKTDIETLNLFKVDLLGLGALTHLDFAFRLLKEHYKTNLSMATIPAQDEAVFDQICRADTIGVFQIESRAQMSMLPRLKPRTYYDLVVEVSLVRPGPITGGMVHPYLRRRAGLEEVTYPHPLLEPVLKKTKGIPLFQEQVMKLAVVAADYSPGEADQLRRDMAAWRQSGRIEQHRDVLVKRMEAKGIAREFAERVFDQIRGFGEYGFPESHAASFALVAYATAYVKHHWPDVFACALLNAWPMGFYSPATLVGDARRHGVQVLPPDVLHSQWNCTLEPQGPTGSCALRIGLRYVQGLGRNDAELILSNRPGPGVPSVKVWKARARARTDAWEKLALGGALEGLGVGRRRGLWEILDTTEPDPLGLDRPPGPEFTEPGVTERVSWDYEALGLSPGAHLLQSLRPKLVRAGFRAAVEVVSFEPDRPIRYAGLVICRQRPGTAKGVLFLTFEDETGLVNAVVWQAVWERYRKVILTSSFLAVEGRIQTEEGVVHVVAERFWVPEGFLAPGEVHDQSHDFH
jgi:error-prone DNA polymerase